MQAIHPSLRPFSPKEQESEPEKIENYVLDSHALFALLQREEGHEIVTDLLDCAENQEMVLHLSLINWGELYYILGRNHGEPVAEEMVAGIEKLPIVIDGVDLQRVLAAARIKARYPVAYADAFAIALADELGAAVVTGDPEFHKVESVVRVLWLQEIEASARSEA
jgi:ribonuclease VapC